MNIAKALRKKLQEEIKGKARAQEVKRLKKQIEQYEKK
jgi:hypothetical protein